ncbi:hypothetical protein BGZ59_007771 [Podila verticillata]|nr:hypothetical protein BGZ59_007771 [Podila verticillata]KFH64883.1 hypothetical protein MVEG_09611 [Podila verticillata NRRL 6337]
MSTENQSADPETTAHKLTAHAESNQPDFPSIVEEKTSTVTFDLKPLLRQYGLNNITRVNHLKDQDMEHYEVKLECHQFLEHRCSLPRRRTESYRALRQVRVENGKLPIKVRWFLASEREEVQVLQGALEQCMLGLKNALPETIQRFDCLEPSEDGTQAAMIYFGSNTLPLIEPGVPHTILLLLRLDIIVDAECSVQPSAFSSQPTLNITEHDRESLSGNNEAQELFNPLIAALTHMLTQDYPLVFSAAKIKQFVWVMEWVQLTANSLYNVYRRASHPREKARMTSYIQTLQSRYPTIPSDDVRLLLEHVFTCHAYGEVGSCHGAGNRSSELVMDPDTDVAMETVQREKTEFRELDEGEEFAYGEIENSDDDDLWSEGGALESDVHIMTDLWAGLDSPDEKDEDDEDEDDVESWSDISMQDD